MSPPLTAVYYTINSAIGPLQRMIGIHRWLQRYCKQRGQELEPYALTSSEAETMLYGEGIGAFKLPSPSAAYTTQISGTRYLAVAKNLVWNSLSLIRPDLLIVDSWPRGAFGELLNAFDFCRRKVFVYRPGMAENAASPDFQAMLPLYDLVLVPEEDGHSDFPATITGPNVRHVGPILSRERDELLEPWDARERLGVAPDDFVLFIAAGGGDDPETHDILFSLCSALMDDPRLQIVVGAGPLYQGPMLQGPRLRWLNTPSHAELMPAFDAAICVAGYNSLYELTFAGVPTAWIPLRSVGDDLHGRVRRYLDTGAGLVLDPSDLRAANIVRTVEGLRDRGWAGLARKKAALLVPKNHARDAAAAALQVLWPEDAIQRAGAAMSDKVLRTLTLHAAELGLLLRIARWLSPDMPNPDEEATTAACTIYEGLRPHALHPPLGLPFIERICALLPPRERPAVRGRTVLELLDGLAVFEDWTESLALLQALVPEPALDTTGFMEQLTALLGRATTHSMTLGDLAEALSSARISPGYRGQGPAIAAIMARLDEIQPSSRRLAK